jgi:hypothetical protein
MGIMTVLLSAVNRLVSSIECQSKLNSSHYRPVPIMVSTSKPLVFQRRFTQLDSESSPRVHFNVLSVTRVSTELALLAP